MPQQQFKGYSQDQMKRIASKLGHTGGLDTFNNYLGSNPAAKGKYNALKSAAVKRYARGGMVRSGYDAGGLAAMSNQDAIQAIYKNPETGLGRSVGKPGLEYYSGKLDSATTPEARESMLKEIQQNILDSAEFENRAATGGQQRYVSAENQIPSMYQTMPMMPGIELPKNIDYEQGDNTANNAAIIQSRYQSDLGRAAGQTGQDHYTGLMDGSAAGNPDDIRADIRGSTEGLGYAATGTQLYVPEDNRVVGLDYRNPLGGTIGDTNDATKAANAKAVADAKAAADAADAAAKAAVPNMLGQRTINQSLAPELVAGSKTTGTAISTNTNQLMDTATGQVDNTTFDPATGIGLPTATAGTATAGSAAKITTPVVKNTATATAADATNKAMLLNTTPQTGTIDDDNKVEAQRLDISKVSDLNAAQESTATQVDGAPTRTMQGGELVDGVADAKTAAAFTEQITAAQGDPSSRATVQGQLATLMTSFDEGNTPAWAAGAMRNVTAQMSARGIGSSSMAGQALIQAALETALPIATADAQTYAQFDLTNLNNRQQRAMLSAQQRAEFMGQEFDQDFQARVLNSNKISEIANMNFTATQAIAIENAQLASTVNLANLSNRQGIVMAEAAALSQLDMSNLNNRQQAQVQNAKTFLDMDIANLDNKQQTSLFKAQQRSISILSDAAADNAVSQFNATSKNQTEQFFANLTSNVSQFNASQKTAVSQSNAGDKTAVSKFNAEIKNQRDQFNAQNSLVINQSNAQWRRQIATADTVAINRTNEINAKALLDISNTAYSNLWQEHRDEMDWTYKVADSEAERYNALARATIAAEAQIEAAGAEADSSFWGSLGSLVGTIAGEYIKTSVVPSP